ncbi:MAG: hypothetical protein JWQ29_1033 [Phenylobacterium sp.]|nr:hypothetical protein [Phenylobacterium sp.]
MEGDALPATDRQRRSSKAAASPGSAAAGGRWLSARPPSLATRMDEAAAAIHAVTAPRIVLIVIGGLSASAILSWTSWAAWVAGALLVEAWTWPAAIRQARGETVTRGQRANFIAAYLTMNGCWALLGIVLWASGTPEGQAGGAILFLSLAAVGMLLFYSTPVVFLFAGAAPAIAALSVIALRDGDDWRHMAPVWGFLGLSMFFNLGRALETPSVQEQKRLLNDSLRNFEILADNVLDVICRTDLKGVRQYISPACFDMLGYRPEELIDIPRWDIHHPDNDTAAVVAAFHRMLADPSRSETMTLRVRHKDGHWLWVQSRAKLVCEKGVPVGVIDVSRDVTDQVAAEEALIEAKMEAESATRAKTEFLANVSHEIRTPMNGVLGALHLLERENISDEGRELMRHAQDSGRMLSQLLNDVLDFSKIEAGQLDLAPEPMRPGEALEAVAMLVGGQARAKGVELRCEIVGGDLWIEADPVRVRQTMFNLIGNAVKFTARGHVTARLAVEPAADGQRQVTIEVEDTGIGMTAEAQAHLFERFRQAEGDTARRFGGTGLGLSITEALARLMGGEIRFSSVEGEGSCFAVTFRAPASDPVSLDTMGEGLLDGIDILLVEDNATNRLVARTMLARLGARVDEAEDGVAGLEAARRGGYDLILMDIQMPHMDGVTATRAIRGLVGPAARVPILGLTANAMVHQRAEYLAAGMDGVVAKPISPAALLGEIARVVAGPDDGVIAEAALATRAR